MAKTISESKVDILVNNNKCRIITGAKSFSTLYNKFSITVPGAFFSPQFQSRRWDGKKHYIDRNGFIATGLLPKLVAFMKDSKMDFELHDDRVIPKKPKIVTKLGSIEARPYQVDVVNSIIRNKLEGIRFPRGIIKAATNAGKTPIAAMLYKTFDLKTALLLNSVDLYRQALEELPLLLGNDFGYIRGPEYKEGNFMVIMVPTLFSRIKEQNSYLASLDYLSTFGQLLVDECDLSASKSYQTCINLFINTYIKVGLSGTPLMSENKVKNWDVQEHFGEILYTIRNRELIDLGYSSEVIVRINQGAIVDKETAAKYKILGLAKEYDDLITKNKQRNSLIIKRVKSRLKAKEYPILIVCRYHKHVEILYKRLKKKLGDSYVIDQVHHKTKERPQIIKKFKEAKIDILVGTHIFKRGQNLPYTITLINASGGKGAESIIQLLGRQMRKHKDSSITHKYVEDFRDDGFYLIKHSRRREIYYKNEDLKIERYY
jgi:ATP-dependent helicase IRC3